MLKLMGMLITYIGPIEYHAILVGCMLKPIPLGYAPFVIYLVRSLLHCHFWVAIVALVVSSHVVIV